MSDLPLPIQSYFDQTPDVLGGKLRLRGTRISVEQVLELLESGATPTEIRHSFPALSEQAVAAVERLAAHYALAAL